LAAVLSTYTRSRESLLKLIEQWVLETASNVKAPNVLS